MEIAAIQVLLFALGAAGVTGLGIFNNTEFLMLTLISMTLDLPRFGGEVRIFAQRI
jgi:hypothetical protein